MAIICDICGNPIDDEMFYKRKVMVLNENEDRWFDLCGTCEHCIILYTTKDLPKMRKEFKSQLDELSKEEPNDNNT